MKIDLEALRIESKSQAVQNVIMRSRMKDYLFALSDLTGDKKYLEFYNELKKYSNLDDRYIYDFESTHMNDVTEFENITVGEMLKAAGNMVYGNNYLDDYLNAALDTAVMIVEYLLIIPVLDIHDLKENVD